MIGVIINVFVLFLGLLMISLGLIVWKKQKLSLIHGKNKITIKEEDIKGYTESIGKAYIISGISQLPMTLNKLFSNDILQFLVILICTLLLILSLVKVAKTDKKYKTGMW